MGGGIVMPPDETLEIINSYFKINLVWSVTYVTNGFEKHLDSFQTNQT